MCVHECVCVSVDFVFVRLFGLDENLGGEKKVDDRNERRLQRLLFRLATNWGGGL